MADLIPYGQDHLVELPLVDYGATDFLTAKPTIAVADLNLRTRTGEAAATARVLGFDSMSELPSPGDVLDEGGAGTAQCTVMFVQVVTGTVGGGTAAGFMFVKNKTGDAWTDNDTIDNTTTGTSDVATVDSTATLWTVDATAQLAGTAGAWAFALDTAFVALTATETQTTRIGVRLVDSATKEWEDTGADFFTFGHPSAYYQPDGNGLVIYDGVTDAAGTGTTVKLTGVPWGDDEPNDHLIGLYDDNAAEWHYRWITGFVESTKIATIEPDLPTGFTPASGDLFQVLVFRRDTMPSELGAQAKLDVQESCGSSDLLTTALSEAYAAAGSTASAAELLYTIHAALLEFDVSGTTLTLRKLDHATAAGTATLDDAANPTDIQRAT